MQCAKILIFLLYVFIPLGNVTFKFHLRLSITPVFSLAAAQGVGTVWAASYQPLFSSTAPVIRIINLMTLYRYQRPHCSKTPLSYAI